MIHYCVDLPLTDQRGRPWRGNLVVGQFESLRARKVIKMFSISCDFPPEWSTLQRILNLSLLATPFSTAIVPLISGFCFHLEGINSFATEPTDPDLLTGINEKNSIPPGATRSLLEKVRH